MNDANVELEKDVKARHRPFRRAFLRGLAVVMPPLLTIVIFLWVWSTIHDYVVNPLEGLTRFAVTKWMMSDVLYDLPQTVTKTIVDEKGQIVGFDYNGQSYTAATSRQWMPKHIFDAVAENPGEEMPSTPEGIYRRWVDITILRPVIVYPLFICVFILLLSILGRFLAAGLGRMLWNTFERVIHRLPLVRNVYGSVKQVTDFVFSEQEIEYTRVVAVEYPRKGIWSLGFVTGDSLLDIRSAANESVMSVLMPTSPAPFTGFTVTVRKSETVDLNITVDQALQFVVSCGVVVPASQQQDAIRQEINAAIAQHVSGNSRGADASGDGATVEADQQRLSEETAIE
jgi:uncharacterized membrane protein